MIIVSPKRKKVAITETRSSLGICGGVLSEDPVHSLTSCKQTLVDRLNNQYISGCFLGE